MSEVDAAAEPSATRRSKRRPRTNGHEGAPAPDEPEIVADAGVPAEPGAIDSPVTSPTDAITDELSEDQTPEPAPTRPTRAQRRLERAAAKQAAEGTKREARAAESAARTEADADDRRRRTEERAAQEAAEAERRRRRADEQTARAAEKAAARAAKRERRLRTHTTRATGKHATEAARLERRHELRARRLAKRAERAEAKAAAELAGLEHRRSKRAGRLEKRRARSDAKSRIVAEKLERRREAARAVAAAVPTTTESADASAQVQEQVGLSRRQRRRERRRQAALERALARVAEGLPPSPEREREDETLAEYLARVEAPILPRRSRRARSRVPVRVRRAAGVTAAVVLVAAAAVLPWAVPEVRSLIADAVPGGDSQVVPVEDPPVEPPEATPGTTPLEHGDGYEGARLASAGTPREVVVPRLHVDSDVLPISGQSGELLPPSDPQVLGWWREGRPVGAAEGSAVITGHTVHTGGGALDNLDKLVVGDSLRVRTDHGWIRYVVQRARIYPTAELARDAEEIFRLDGPGRLVVITCDDWNGESYESNAVVFASPVGDEPFHADDVPDAGPDAGP